MKDGEPESAGTCRHCGLPAEQATPGPLLALPFDDGSWAHLMCHEAAHAKPGGPTSKAGQNMHDPMHASPDEPDRQLAFTTQEGGR